MLGFLAAPFKLIMFSCAYISTFIDNKLIIIAVEDEDSEGD